MLRLLNAKIETYIGILSRIFVLRLKTEVEAMNFIIL